MKNLGDYLLGVMGGFSLATLLVLQGWYLKDEVIERFGDTPNRNSTYGHSCKGKLFEKCPRDSVEYTQHPQEKCWHTNWENR